MITHVETIAIYVSDQERAKNFYLNALGFELRKDVPFGAKQSGKRWIEVAPKGAETVLVLFTPPGLENRIGTFSGLVFLCDNVHSTFQQLQSRGVVFSQEPVERGHGWWATFQDPDGNEFGLSQPG